MEAVLIYFTGTYNTRILTNKVKERLINKGYNVDVIEIQKDSKIIDVKDYDLIGFSYPIYGFNAPKAFDKYVKKLNIQKGQKCFIYKNSGETFAMNNSSSRYLKKIIKKHKANLINEKHYVMPYNIHFKYEDLFVKEIFSYNEKLLDIQMYEIENNIVDVIKTKWIYSFAAWFVLILRFGAFVNSFLYKVDKKKCIDCSMCIKACPMQNIYKNKKGKIKFKHGCMMCMRCSFYCPKDAINIGFLQWWGWKVNGGYNFNKILNDENITGQYITKDSKGFYKCYIKSWNDINNKYNEYFKK